jgi:hypothetical protein
MKTIYHPQHSLVNLSNTILQHFGAPIHHQPMKVLLDILHGKHKVCVLLFDGMGRHIIHTHLNQKQWLRTHHFCTITSTFPSTTAAATNAFLSGKYPIEIGWLGWAHYFPEHDRMLELFTGKDYLLQQPFIPAEEIRSSIEYQSIFEQIKQTNPAISIQQVWPDIRSGGAKDLPQFFSQLQQALSSSTDHSLTYGYWLDPDKSIHKLGTKHPTITDIILEIQERLKTLSDANPDTTFIVLADHGLVDIQFLNIQAHQDLFSLLVRSFAFEPRAATFFVKPGQQNIFEKRFLKYYRKHFVLMDKVTVMKKKLYGYGLPHPRADEFIGDFVAIAKGPYGFTHGVSTDTMPLTMKAHHAGMTKQEMAIDVMVLNR